MSRSGGILVGTWIWKPDHPYEPWREIEIQLMYHELYGEDKSSLSWWLTFREKCLEISNAIVAMENAMCYYHPHVPMTAKQRIGEYARKLRGVWWEGFDITWRPE